jgi:hypothetical protein
VLQLHCKSVEDEYGGSAAKQEQRKVGVIYSTSTLFQREEIH